MSPMLGSLPLKQSVLAALGLVLLLWVVASLTSPYVFATTGSELASPNLDRQLIAMTTTTATETETTTSTVTATVTATVATTEAAAAAPPTATPSSHLDASSRPLVLYAYSDKADGIPLQNLKFFLSQGLHGAADFVFIFQGESNASALVPVESHANVRVVQRANTCYDLGAYGEVLRKDDLWKRYSRFVLLNTSLRGPFIPHWSPASASCWTDLFLDQLTDRVKLVGMTANCWPRFHVQSMIWATDSVGIDLLLNPPPSTNSSSKAATAAADQFGDATQPVGLAGCYDGWDAAVHAEVGATALIRDAGYEVDVMMAAFHASANYIDECDSSANGDVLRPGAYFGTDVHPYELVFMKTNRGVNPVQVGRLTEWHLARNLTSWETCKSR
ncbi:hypothetical protein B0T26DRAFT_674041 [Lasiosphaeria miniovina]|uniref:Uncharacterized protein n=1 Tax=Lasiosphaeria miniovina TaxID=1954250 RepID=A0AA40AUQ6_9PEZI|nr:uncharacterized protein B0T26DRAFT_674041 [Lasiosphaeria miniovina]KAK0722321.1 hypothetical protein B0T26DRAFT_674041 [Lasiosphaeria miniovina]